MYRMCCHVHLANDQNVILKFSLIISLVYKKDTDIEAPVPASVSHHCLVLSCLASGKLTKCSIRDM